MGYLSAWRAMSWSLAGNRGAVFRVSSLDRQTESEAGPEESWVQIKSPIRSRPGTKPNRTESRVADGEQVLEPRRLVLEQSE